MLRIFIYFQLITIAMVGFYARFEMSDDDVIRPLLVVLGPLSTLMLLPCFFVVPWVILYLIFKQLHSPLERWMIAILQVALTSSLMLAMLPAVQ